MIKKILTAIQYVATFSDKTTICTFESLKRAFSGIGRDLVNAFFIDENHDGLIFISWYVTLSMILMTVFVPYFWVFTAAIGVIVAAILIAMIFCRWPRNRDGLIQIEAIVELRDGRKTTMKLWYPRWLLCRKKSLRTIQKDLMNGKVIDYRIKRG